MAFSGISHRLRCKTTRFWFQFRLELEPAPSPATAAVVNFSISSNSNSHPTLPNLSTQYSNSSVPSNLQISKLFSSSHNLHRPTCHVKNLKIQNHKIKYQNVWGFQFHHALDERHRSKLLRCSPIPIIHRRKLSSGGKFLDENSPELQQNLDEDMKNDPYVKTILEEIRKDLTSLGDDDTDKVESSSVDTKNPEHADVGRESVLETSESFDDNVQAYSYAQDIEEFGYHDEAFEPEIQEEKVLPISLERGKTGVFDLDEMLVLLEHLGAENIVNFPVPPEANFCDHMVVLSAKSKRHLQAMNEELLWVHKRKKSAEDETLRIEGFRKSDWCAMDMGNIVLHMFYGEAREYYDIETLWTLGPEQESETFQDPYVLSEEDLFWLEVTKSKRKKGKAEADTEGEGQR